MLDEPTAEDEMMLDGLKDKLTRAANVARERTQDISDRADALIAKGDAIAKKADEKFAPHIGVLSEHDKSLDALDDALRVLSNAPLDGSKST